MKPIKGGKITFPYGVRGSLWAADARTFAENVFRMSYEVKTQVEG